MNAKNLSVSLLCVLSICIAFNVNVQWSVVIGMVLAILIIGSFDYIHEQKKKQVNIQEEAINKSIKEIQDRISRINVAVGIKPTT